jgi:UDP-glucose 4-epimerase
MKRMKTACVTGGCGFIGSHLVRRLLARGWNVVAFDNLTVGTVAMLPENSRLRFIQGDIRDEAAVRDAIRGCEIVYHFAAPTNVRTALQMPRHDIDHGVNGTQSVLEAMRVAGVGKIVYASSSCVYGSGLPQPVSEEMGPLVPSSVYGASKLAGEGLIGAYSHTFGIQSWLFRFPNVVGPALTHGVILDFIRRLHSEPDCLTIYGNGRQTKTYCWVEDCVEGVLDLLDRADDEVNTLNVTAPGSTTVRRIAELVVEAMGLREPHFMYTGGAAGWQGDVPIIQLDGSRAAELGWRARLTSDEAVRSTIQCLLDAQ